MPYYCQKCGAELKETISYTRYNIETGEPIIIKQHSCPQARWFNTHTSFIERNDENNNKDYDV
jgi:hypothetical protein